MNTTREKKKRKENISLDQNPLIKMIKKLESNSKSFDIGSLEYKFEKQQYYKNKKGYDYIKDLKNIINKFDSTKSECDTSFLYKLIYNETSIKDGTVTCNFNVDLLIEYEKCDEAICYLITSSNNNPSSSNNNKKCETIQKIDPVIIKNHQIKVNLTTNTTQTQSYQLCLIIGLFIVKSCKFTLYSFKQMKRIIKNNKFLEPKKIQKEARFNLQFIGHGLLQNDNNKDMISDHPSFKIPMKGYIMNSINSDSLFRNHNGNYRNNPLSAPASFPQVSNATEEMAIENINSVPSFGNHNGYCGHNRSNVPVFFPSISNVPKEIPMDNYILPPIAYTNDNFQNNYPYHLSNLLPYSNMSQNNNVFSNNSYLNIDIINNPLYNHIYQKFRYLQLNNCIGPNKHSSTYYPYF